MFSGEAAGDPDNGKNLGMEGGTQRERSMKGANCKEKVRLGGEVLGIRRSSRMHRVIENLYKLKILAFLYKNIRF